MRGDHFLSHENEGKEKLEGETISTSQRNESQGCEGNQAPGNKLKMAFAKSSSTSSRCVFVALLAMLVVFCLVHTWKFYPTPFSIEQSPFSPKTKSSTSLKTPTNPSPKKYPHTSYPLAPFYCPQTETPATKTYKVRLDTTYSLPEHLRFLTQRLPKSIHLEEPQNLQVSQDGSRIFTLSGVTDKVLEIIRKDPGVWFVGCEDWKELRVIHGELKT